MSMMVPTYHQHHHSGEDDDNDASDNDNYKGSVNDNNKDNDGVAMKPDRPKQQHMGATNANADKDSNKDLTDTASQQATKKDENVKDHDKDSASSASLDIGACCLCHCSMDFTDKAAFFRSDRWEDYSTSASSASASPARSFTPTATARDNDPDDSSYFFRRTDPYLPRCLYDPHNALVYCDSCNRLYHQKCHFVPVLILPRGRWTCLLCASISATITTTKAKTKKTRRPKNQERQQATSTKRPTETATTKQQKSALAGTGRGTKTKTTSMTLRKRGASARARDDDDDKAIKKNSKQKRRNTVMAVSRTSSPQRPNKRAKTTETVSTHRRKRTNTTSAAAVGPSQRKRSTALTATTTTTMRVTKSKGSNVTTGAASKAILTAARHDGKAGDIPPIHSDLSPGAFTWAPEQLAMLFQSPPCGTATDSSVLSSTTPAAAEKKATALTEQTVIPTTTALSLSSSSLQQFTAQHVQVWEASWEQQTAPLKAAALFQQLQKLRQVCQGQASNVRLAIDTIETLTHTEKNRFHHIKPYRPSVSTNIASNNNKQRRHRKRRQPSDDDNNSDRDRDDTDSSSTDYDNDQQEKDPMIKEASNDAVTDAATNAHHGNVSTHNKGSGRTKEDAVAGENDNDTSNKEILTNLNDNNSGVQKRGDGYDPAENGVIAKEVCAYDAPETSMIIPAEKRGTENLIHHQHHDGLEDLIQQQQQQQHDQRGSRGTDMIHPLVDDAVRRTPLDKNGDENSSPDPQGLLQQSSAPSEKAGTNNGHYERIACHGDHDGHRMAQPAVSLCQGRNHTVASEPLLIVAAQSTKSVPKREQQPSEASKPINKPTRQRRKQPALQVPREPLARWTVSQELADNLLRLCSAKLKLREFLRNLHAIIQSHKPPSGSPLDSSDSDRHQGVDDDNRCYSARPTTATSDDLVPMVVVPSSSTKRDLLIDQRTGAVGSAEMAKPRKLEWNPMPPLSASNWQQYSVWWYQCVVGWVVQYQQQQPLQQTQQQQQLGDSSKSKRKDDFVERVLFPFGLQHLNRRRFEPRTRELWYALQRQQHDKPQIGNHEQVFMSHVKPTNATTIGQHKFLEMAPSSPPVEIVVATTAVLQTEKGGAGNSSHDQVEQTVSRDGSGRRTVRSTRASILSKKDPAAAAVASVSDGKAMKSARAAGTPNVFCEKDVLANARNHQSSLNKAKPEKNCSVRKDLSLKQHCEANNGDDHFSLDDLQCCVCHQSDSTDDNDLLLCDGPGCFRAYHMQCIHPAITPDQINTDQDEDWFCPLCSTLADLMWIIQVNSMGGDEWEQRRWAWKQHEQHHRQQPTVTSCDEMDARTNQHQDDVDAGSLKSWEVVEDVFPEAVWQHDVCTQLADGTRNTKTDHLLITILGLDDGRSTLDVEGNEQEDDDDDGDFDLDSFQSERRRAYGEGTERSSEIDSEDDSHSSQATLVDMSVVDYEVGRDELDALSLDEEDSSSGVPGSPSPRAEAGSNRVSEQASLKQSTSIRRRRSRRLNKKRESSTHGPSSEKQQDPGKLDRANILVQKRNRKRVDYRKLNDAIFGDLTPMEIANLDDIEEYQSLQRKPGSSRHRKRKSISSGSSSSSSSSPAEGIARERISNDRNLNTEGSRKVTVGDSDGDSPNTRSAKLMVRRRMAERKKADGLKVKDRGARTSTSMTRKPGGRAQSKTPKAKPPIPVDKTHALARKG